MSFETNEDMARQWRHILRRQNQKIQNQGRDQGDHGSSSSTWNLDRESVTVAQKPGRVSVCLSIKFKIQATPRFLSATTPLRFCHLLS